MIMWTSKRILIIGVARQGIALARYLVSQGAEVIITDLRGPDDLKEERTSLSDLDIEWALGGHPHHLLDGCDWVCPSGGVPLTIPLIVEARLRGIPLTNDSQIFLETAPCRVIGITGSAGKTTTTILIGRIAAAALGPERTWIGGNIGNPLIQDLEKMEPDHIAVMELSSFQLEIMTRSPQMAAILNITPNHLDRHQNMAAYTQAKAQILLHQTSSDTAVLSRDDIGAWGLRSEVQGNLFAFGEGHPPARHPGIYLKDEMVSYWDGQRSETLFSRDIVSLRGEHNMLNILASCAVAQAEGFPLAAIHSGIEGFTGVEHRLEFVKSWGGADWYNDSIATAPERAMAAIRSFDQPLILLAGGRDKNLPWDRLAALIKDRVDHLIIFGESREIVSTAMGVEANGDRPHSVDICENLEGAVQVASRIVEQGDVVLLSPGGTSFDEFHNFAERGEWFRQWVKKLP